MPDESGQPIEAFSDEELWEMATKERDAIAAGDLSGRERLKPIELERMRRRALAYDVSFAAAETDEDRQRIASKKEACLAGMAKLEIEGFSNEVQRIG